MTFLYSEYMEDMTHTTKTAAVGTRVALERTTSDYNAIGIAIFAELDRTIVRAACAMSLQTAREVMDLAGRDPLAIEAITLTIAREVIQQETGAVVAPHYEAIQ